MATTVSRETIGARWGGRRPSRPHWVTTVTQRDLQPTAVPGVYRVVRKDGPHDLRLALGSGR